MSIREIGYGDATINKKMKDYVNLLFSVIDKIDGWETFDENQKIEILKKYVDEASDYNIYVKYIDKYRAFLAKNTFNNLSKEILSF